jgi:hypothetical protein
MAGTGPWIYTTGTGNLSDVLTTIFLDDITNNINRACVLPQVLPVKFGRGKNIYWANRFTNTTAYTGAAAADGATVSYYNTDIKVPAYLEYTTYMDAVAIGGRAQAAAASAGNPAELADLLGEEIGEGIRRLSLAIATDFYTGTGASNQLQGLYSTTGSTYGALLATGTYAGIDRSTYTEWACNVDAGSSVNRALTVELMRDMRRKIYVASGERPDLIVTDPIQFEKYGQLLGTNRRLVQEVTMRGQKITLDGGFMALDFDGIPVIEDALHPANKMSFLNTRYCYITQLPFYSPQPNDMGEVTLTGTPEEQFGAGNIKLSARIKHLAESGDVLKLQIITYPQIVVRRPNACGSITYLAS